MQHALNMKQSMMQAGRTERDRVYVPTVTDDLRRVLASFSLQLSHRKHAAWQNEAEWNKR